MRMKQEPRELGYSLFQARRQGLLYLNERLVRFVSGPRPKEPPETISPMARHNMNVKVRHALADSIIDRNKCPFCLHCFLHGSRQELCPHKKASHKILGKIEQGFIMRPRNQQAMPWEEGAPIKERNRHGVLEDYFRVGLPRGYTAKNACFQ